MHVTQSIAELRYSCSCPWQPVMSLKTRDHHCLFCVQAQMDGWPTSSLFNINTGSEHHSAHSYCSVSLPFVPHHSACFASQGLLFPAESNTGDFQCTLLKTTGLKSLNHHVVHLQHTVKSNVKLKRCNNNWLCWSDFTIRYTDATKYSDVDIRMELAWTVN